MTKGIHIIYYFLSYKISYYAVANIGGNKTSINFDSIIQFLSVFYDCIQSTKNQAILMDILKIMDRIIYVISCIYPS